MMFFHSRLVAVLYTAMFAFVVVGQSEFSAADDDPQPFDILIRYGTVIDGRGRRGVQADVGIRDGRIVSIGDLSGTTARVTIDAASHVVSPGFIDLHSHADRGILKFRSAENYIRQGVTTLVCGNCGSSPTDIAGYFRKLRDGGTGPNIVQLIGHGSVRGAVIGSENRRPTADDLAAMQKLVRQSMEAGAVGMSTSLRYGLGAYAETGEVAACAKQVAPYGGFYATHMRDEGTRIVEAVDEALHIGKVAGIPLHISHHKISSASVFGLTRQTLTMIDRARDSGADVTLDQYPYGAGSGGTSLYVPQSSLSGGLAEFRKRVANADQRAQIIESVEELLVRKLYEADQSPSDPDHTAIALARIQIARAAYKPELEGKNVTQILKSRKKSVTLRNGAELLIEFVSNGVGGINHTLDTRPGGDVDRVMQHPQTCIASDGSVFEFGLGNPHPRSYGCYPRVLGYYVRERKLLKLETAIHKMTQLPARRLGWTDRGLIKEGYWADLVVFDPKTIGDQATFLKPHQYSVGVEHVVVRGQFVLKSGKMTGKLPGRPIASVPVADTRRKKLRRDLLAILQSYDGNFGLYFQRVDSSDEFTINADLPFSTKNINGSGTKRPEISLRQTMQQLVGQKGGQQKLERTIIDGRSVLIVRSLHAQETKDKAKGVLGLMLDNLSDADRHRFDKQGLQAIVARLEINLSKNSHNEQSP